MTGIPAARSEFFGKDSFVPFIGCVEDVNDPKHAHRVKVRCIGWHPKSKKSPEGNDDDSLTTDDLPWARVLMPVTHPQQGRIGGKHGLLTGCWVFGFFLDGEEAQDPMVLSTLNFTPNASGEDDREDKQGQEGKDTEEDQAFAKATPSPKTQPNFAIRTTEEKGKKFGAGSDKAGDGHNYDHDGVKCGGKKPLRSAAANERQELPNSAETPTGQRTEIAQGDGRCGSTQHARDDISMLVKRYLPSGDSRYVYNDVVWNNYTGQYLNLNGIMAQLAIAICSELKSPINSKKAVENDKLRKTKSSTTVAKPDRDGEDRDTVEDKQSMLGDTFNAKMQTSLIDKLCDIMMKMLQALNNGGELDPGANPPGTATPITPILNPGALCITDTILNNVENIVDNAIEVLLDAAATEVEETYDILKNALAKKSFGLLPGLALGMMFPLSDTYAEQQDAFNKKGNESQDSDNKDGECRTDRVYDTELGGLASIGGFNAGAGGGESGGGQGSSGVSRHPNIGFGGKPVDLEMEPTNLLCEEAYTPYEPDPGYSNPDGSQNDDDGDPNEDIDCKNNSQCPEGYICVDGKCFDAENIIIGEGNGTGLECVGPEDCPRGFTCIDGECILTEGLIWPDDVPFEGIGRRRGSRRTNRRVDQETYEFEGIGRRFGSKRGNRNFQVQGDFEGIGTRDGSRRYNRRFKPDGKGARALALSLPSSEVRAAKNFLNGTPNTVAIIRRGEKYFFNNREDDSRVFPSIYIKGYKAQPIPVVDRLSGEMVAILTAAAAFDPNAPSAPVSIIPDRSLRGITTDDPAYSVTLGGFHIANTGFDYTDPVIQIYDRDKDTYENASATLIVADGRIVDYEINNNGTEFRRLPRVRIIDKTGFGADLYPIMNVQERDKEQLLPEPIQRIYCPNNQTNLL